MEAPKKIKSYDIVETIGFGGVGVVYKARHMYKNEIVAIKSLAHHYAFDENKRKRFRLEAKILSELRHPNIVKVFDFIEEQNGLHIVMEFIEGKTLEKIIESEQKPMSTIVALQLFEQILDAIEYAHSSGVIHRDIKPSNIMITKDNIVKVMDFGIAHLEGSDFTRTGTKLGTLYYMSPEAIRGEKTDERTDIYSLGITFYEMLTGRLEYKDIAGKMSEFDLMQKILNEELRDPKYYYPYLSDWLVDIVRKATRKDKDKRIQSVKEFKDLIKNQGAIKKENQEFISYKTLDVESRGILSLAFSSDGFYLASGNMNGTLALWDAKTWDLIKMLEGHTDSVWTIAFSPDGSLLASGSDDKTIKIWRPTTGVLLKTLSGHTHWVEAVAFSLDGKILASGGRDKIIIIWDISTGKILHKLEDHSEPISSIAFNRDGFLMASASLDSTIKIWDACDWKLLRTIKAHDLPVKSIAYSPVDNSLASCGDDKIVKIWNAESGELIAEFEGHRDWVETVAFSVDGKLIASAGYDNTVKIWNIEKNELMQTLLAHRDEVNSAAFSVDGQFLATGSSDGALKIWKMKFAF